MSKKTPSGRVILSEEDSAWLEKVMQRGLAVIVAWLAFICVYSISDFGGGAAAAFIAYLACGMINHHSKS